MFKKKKDEDAKPIEQEIAELQRKFRVLENDKRACSEDSQGILRKQRATIEKLTRENRKMKVELQETRSAAGSQAENRLALETIEKLTEQKEHLKTKLDTETKLAESLQTTFKSTNDQIFSLRGEMSKNGGINAASDNTRAVQKQIRILENRLDKALQKFNEAITANRGLRENIDTLRRERVVFDDIYRKLENELSQKKKEMANIIEQANAAYEARDQAQAQMAQLKQQADREHVEFEKEWKELGKLIQNDKKMKEFMKTRVKTIKEPKEEVKETTLCRTKEKSVGDTAKTIKAKVVTFEEAFANIQAATGICDLEELVQNFISSEDQNFSLFKYNNELSADIEKLEQQIADYKEEVVQLSGTGVKKEDTEKVKILETLEERWNDVDRKATYYDEKNQEAQQTLNSIRTGTDNIFRRLGCGVDEASGLGNGITEANMLQYLGLIEKCINDLLKQYESTRDGDDELETTRPTRNQASTSSLQVKLPSTVEDYSDDEEEDEEDDQRPFTVEELKEKTRKKTKKLNAKAKNKSAHGR